VRVERRREVRHRRHGISLLLAAQGMRGK
jgi:hypothetical protein